MDITKHTRTVGSLLLAVAAASAAVVAVTQPSLAAGRPTCDGAPATVVGTSGRDVLRGTSRADVIWAGAGDDVVRGRGGADVICGGAGKDRLVGGGGDDTCTGGGGRDQLVSCRTSDTEAWTAAAQGTLDLGNGLVERWAATYRMAPVVEGFTWAGSASIDWFVGGTDAQGCTYGGHATLPGRASLTVWDVLDSYAHQVYRVAGTTVEVTVDCPDQEPRVEVYQPLDTNAAESSAPLPGDPSGPLAGRATYVPTNAPDGAVDWVWKAVPRN
jgi:hypothetical protein